MPQLSPVTVSDGTADHTFTPLQIDPQTGIATLQEDVNGVPVSNNVLTISSRKRNNKTVAKLVLHMPVTTTDAATGNVTISRVAKMATEFEYSAYSTSEERGQIRAIMAAVLASSDSLIADTLDGAQGIY